MPQLLQDVLYLTHPVTRPPQPLLCIPILYCSPCCREGAESCVTLFVLSMRQEELGFVPQ